MGFDLVDAVPCGCPLHGTVPLSTMRLNSTLPDACPQLAWLPDDFSMMARMHFFARRTDPLQRIARNLAETPRRGNLAAMLAAAQKSKRSPETGDLSLQVSLVAGACNQLPALPDRGPRTADPGPRTPAQNGVSGNRTKLLRPFSAASSRSSHIPIPAAPCM
jgi:hypothetical protein